MKIVGVCACTVGIAHTYIAQEKLEKAAAKKDFDIHLETQGTIGTQDALTPEDIESADIAILAVDVKIKGMDRFANITKITVPTDIAIKSPNKLLDKAAEIASKKQKAHA